MASPFKLAIVGCGKIAASHVEAALASPLVDVVALVDPTEGRAQALADRFGIEVVLARDIGEVGSAVDGAVIATPNHTHAELADGCLGQGLSVLIEKPLAITMQEGERIRDAGRRSGRTVAVGYVSRFRDNVRLMARLVHDGYFGRIRRFAYQYGTRGGWAPMSGYNLDRRTSGGGVLVTTGTHFIDRMLDWFGYPEEAFLLDDAAGGPEANATAHFSYRGGPVGIARFSKTTAMPAGFVMETDRGMVVLKDRSDADVLLRPLDTPDLEISITRRTAHEEPRDEFVRQLEDFVRAARDGGEPTVTVEQGLQSVRLLQYLYGHRRPGGERDAQTMVLPA